ncbi:MAG: glycosyltransferase family 39 protein [Clostridia bacterium]|nr:glycosyltransferase family 39 protein [Clostridia bacterium]
MLRLIWIISVETKPISDYDLLYKAAKAINSGNFNYIKGIEYFQQWVYQLGFVVYQTLILKIFGEGYVVLKLLNVLFSVGTCVLVYLTAAKVFNENVGRIAGLAYAIYIESIYMCSVLTNQILASFLFYLALYLAICGARKYTFILVGVFIAIGNAIRPEGPVIIASIAVFYLLFRGSDSSGETDVQKGHFKSILKSLLHRSGLPVGVIIVFFIVTQVFSFAIVHTGVSDYPLTNRNPLWKFVLGFNHQSGGMYNPKDDNYISKYPIGPERDAQEKKLIIERTKDKKKLVRLFFTKFKTMWADFDHSFINFVTPGTTLTPNKIKLVAYTEKINYTLMILFIIISLISIYMNKERFRSYHPLLIMVLGFIFIHIFIEVQLRYRYLVLPSFFIIGSYGIYVSAKYIVKLKPVLPIINVKKTS